MQKWYVEDYLTHKCVKNSGEKPQYFVEDDHGPIVPKAVFYQVPEDEEPMNTTAAREVGSTQVIMSDMDEAAFLRSQIVEIRWRKDGLYAERAEQANREVQIRSFWSSWTRWRGTACQSGWRGKQKL